VAAARAIVLVRTATPLHANLTCTCFNNLPRFSALTS